jgi:hypothetical protein
MAAKWEWIDEKQRVMYIEYSDEVTVQDIDTVVSAMLEELPKGSLYIASETTGARFPVNMISLRSLPEFVRHPNLKHMALVQGSALVQYLGKLLAGSKISMHTKIEDAVAEAQKQAAAKR